MIDFTNTSAETVQTELQFRIMFAFFAATPTGARS